MYYFDKYGWYTSTPIAGRETITAPDTLSETVTLGEIRANFTGHEWASTPYAIPPEPLTEPNLERQAEAWERIKHDRDRRKSLGVKVGDHWYHSDADSRIQQLSLFMMGAAVPPVQWKTLTLSHPPVFVTMTQAIAGGIFQATSASDAAIFAAAEVHRVAMEASSTPESYDISTGWPVSIEDDL